ncbi:hypothetical protein [Mesonia sp.]|uniref:hypothetical protein n=1 Tax=Mesonia sp. TaxID=1960830 RepID=UPI00177370AD|nr:hypothetical protein [Mesonia sp.]HIB38044.1 hypothetical protein [Mesonia sp.]HIO27912.1 hypothetical protein [Flavobacteriaceae bacterium]
MKKKRFLPVVIALSVLNVFQGVQLFRVLENSQEMETWRIVFAVAGFTIIFLFSIYIIFRMRKISTNNK